MTISIFHTDCLVKTRNNYDLIPDPTVKYSIAVRTINKPIPAHWIRDQLQLNVALCVKHVLAVLTGLTSAMNIA